MRLKQRVQGKFVSCSGFRKVTCLPGGRYELIVVDWEGRPVSHVTEWYRLRKMPGCDGTRRTYLSFLLPFFSYLLHQGVAWNDVPTRLRRAVKDFLLDDVSCHMGCDTDLDGYRINLTGASSFGNLARDQSTTYSLLSSPQRGSMEAKPCTYVGIHPETTGNRPLMDSHTCLNTT